MCWQGTELVQQTTFRISLQNYLETNIPDVPAENILDMLQYTCSA